VVFTPEPGDIGILDFSRAPELIKCGRKAADEHMPAILAGYERLKASSRRQ
jgi:predicted acylesterase/phospholipase RssA